MSVFKRGLEDGIDLAIETLNETNIEVTIVAVTKQLNKMKWLGRDDWASEYIEAYVDNLRGNINGRVIGSFMRWEIFKIQGCNYSIIKRRKVMNYFGNLIKKYKSK